jgi:hypothetical protein
MPPLDINTILTKPSESQQYSKRTKLELKPTPRLAKVALDACRSATQNKINIKTTPMNTFIVDIADTDAILDKNEPIMKTCYEQNPNKSDTQVKSPSDKTSPTLSTKITISSPLFNSWDPVTGKINGTSTTYPTKGELICKGFGRPSLNHSFTREKHFTDVLIHIFKSAYLDPDSEHNLRRCHPLFDHLKKVIYTLKKHDFSTLTKYNKNYASQTEIPVSRVKNFLAAAIHYDLHIPSVYRYIGGNYTAAYRDIPEILSHIKNVVPHDIYTDVHRIFTHGTPRIFRAESTRENFDKYRQYGNHTSIDKFQDKVRVLMNKEEKNSYVMVFPCWLARFIPDMHLTPQSIVVQPGKNDRLVFDGSAKLDWDSVPVNCMTHSSNEPDLIYGTTWTRHLEQIWNLRISYPDLEILVFDDDVSGAFRHAKHNPDIAAAIAFVINEHLFVPTGQTFGSNTSPANWEPIARARALLASHLHNRSGLIEKHKNILDKVQFSEPPTPQQTFVPAVRDAIHTGVFDKLGKRKKPKHNTFVDDNLMANILAHMKQTMAASIESLLILLGYKETEVRRFALSEDKYFKTKCSFEREQLGLLVNTRAMIVALPDQKRKKLINILLHWHKGRRSYTLRDIAELIGGLLHAAQIAPWARYLFIAIQDSVRASLRKNSKLQKSSKQFQLYKKIISQEKLGPAFKAKADFYRAKVAKDLWNNPSRAYINRSFRAELAMIQAILNNPAKYSWSSPIAHLIPRIADYEAWGDSSLYGAGGFSLDLKFWWQFDWPKNIQDRNITTIKIRDPKSGETISINALEYATILINYAAASQVVAENTDPTAPKHPVLLNWADNTAAISWTKKMCKSSEGGKALSRILCGQMINNNLGINASHIAGVDNVLADRISRVHTSNTNPEFTELLQEFPNLQFCRRYHPNPELVSNICQALLSGHVVDPTKPMPNGHFETAKGIS